MWYYDQQPRKKVVGGIRAQSKRGAFGTTWWAKRWIAVLESFHLGGRLERGKTYARSGQVINIDIAPGVVTSKVQGSAPKPYKMELRLKELTTQQWNTVLAQLANEAVYAAQLLAGQMPEGVEDVFQDAGVPLFPQKAKDLETSCSCPDYENPCKHIAAVYLLLAEEFDRNPFWIFQMRGRSREQVLAELTAAGAQAAPPPIPGEPLPSDPAAYWQPATLPPEPLAIVPAANSTAWLRRLGPFPFWRGEKPLADVLAAAYEQASKSG